MSTAKVEKKPDNNLNIDSASMEQELEFFRQRFPEYEKTTQIDELRAEEYGRLDRVGHVYLDYTGGGMYSEYQLREHGKFLKDGIFGNPHSNNPSSLASTKVDESARRYVLEYFNASPEEYTVIFTHNASGALKIVGESYPFGPGSRYLLTFDNHNAVNGMREFARAKCASITYVPNAAPELRIDETRIEEELAKPNPHARNLFVYPAQSNFSGVQHSLEWISKAHAFGWDVVLDAAAFVPTNELDLSKYHPDFVPLSFYKMIGYPTGVGCLIAKRSALKFLRPPWFAGGTIEMASVQGDRYLLSEGEKAFEEGTIDYLNLPAVEIGLRYMKQIGVQKIHERVTSLTAWLLEKLAGLHHKNGTPVIEIYGPRDTLSRGGSIALNFLDQNGRVFNFHYVEEASSAFNISLRTGCFCNPGAGEIAFGLTKTDLVACFDEEERASFERCIIAAKGKTAGAVRISLGIVSNFSDVYNFVRFAETFRDKSGKGESEKSSSD
ncbi:aminotransferase class V-fold PLP-dependent enzyme [bacterium]|nr:MAG: aminotransferase class V-fold PLP-dependent enzyme [bacterium]